jgi:HD-like signal output (HDOD) protein/prolyl-tRNA editing enzyme YbaK/EbsC (Cys-tRNA(Pro) deacylase)
MSMPRLLRTLLSRELAPFDVLDETDVESVHPLDSDVRAVPLNCLVDGALFRDADGLMLALYPSSHQLQPEQLQNALHRKLSYVASDALTQLSLSLEQGALDGARIPRFQVIVDEQLGCHEHVFIKVEDSGSLLRLRGDDLGLLGENVLVGSRFSALRAPTGNDLLPKTPAPKLDLRTRIARIKRLPAVPHNTQHLLQLYNNPDSTIDELAAFVSADPILAAQVMRHANSALFGQSGSVTTLEDAIFRVLGFDTVINLALGVVTARGFMLPQPGRLGSHNFWRQAVMSAGFSHRLARLVPGQPSAPRPGTAYLAALLHNIGYLVLAQLFKTEYFWLSKLVDSKPDVEVAKVEQRLLGITHAELGALLMEAWNMPEEVVTVVREHHNPGYRGKHANYAHIVLLADRLLACHGISDTGTDELPEPVLQQLGISDEQAIELMTLVAEDRAAIAATIRQLTA